MPDFKKSNFNGPRRPFNKGGFGSRSGGPRELYDAECNNCNKRCQVPFIPNGKKPVYCTDCFSQNDDRPQKPRFEKGNFNRSRPPGPSAPPARDSRIDDIKRQLDGMNTTLERLVHTLESSNRAAALSKEVRRHVPAAKPATAPKRTAAKKAVKGTKKVSKRA